MMRSTIVIDKGQLLPVTLAPYLFSASDIRLQELVWYDA